MKSFNLFVLLYLFSVVVYCQEITGHVENNQGEAVPYANVIARTDTTGLVISYSFTDSQGDFVLYVKNNRTVLLEVSAIGYEKKQVYVGTDTLKAGLLVSLTPEYVQLTEVVIQQKRPLVIKGDTVKIETSFFASGGEENVEELLQALPGITVENDGTIKVGNREIDKLMVDGVDFFDKGYRILSKNMPATPIDRVEIINNYLSNEMLKGIADSDKVALNLKLKDDAKRVWFGNLSAGSNFINRFDAGGNLMNFGKVNKSYILGRGNNIGLDATGKIEQLVHPIKSDALEYIGDDQGLATLLELRPYINHVSYRRVNDNNTYTSSINTSSELSKGLTLKANFFYNFDRQAIGFAQKDSVQTADAGFVNFETNDFNSRKHTIFGRVDLQYKKSAKKKLEVTSKFNWQQRSDKTALTFNDSLTHENLVNNNTYFDIRMVYSYKPDTSRVKLLTLRYIYEQIPANYEVDRFFFQELFPGSAADKVNQSTFTTLSFLGGEGRVINKISQRHFLDISLGVEYSGKKFNTVLGLLNEDGSNEYPIGYQNNLFFAMSDLYGKLHYIFNLKKLSISTGLVAHQLFSDYNQENGRSTNGYFYLIPDASLKLKLREHHILKAFFAYNIDNAEITSIYSNFLLTGYRSFRRGYGQFVQTDGFRFRLSYDIANWQRGFFINAGYYYRNNFSYLTSRSLLVQNFYQSELYLAQAKLATGGFLNAEYYIQPLHSTLKFTSGLSSLIYENGVNANAGRSITNRNFYSGVSLKSGFLGFFNFTLGARWDFLGVLNPEHDRILVNNTNYFDLFFNWEKLSVTVKSDLYRLNNNLPQSTTTYFIDARVKYQLIHNKLNVGLDTYNLLNNETFVYYNVSDISTTSFRYRLLPRIILLKVVYNFGA